MCDVFDRCVEFGLVFVMCLIYMFVVCGVLSVMCLMCVCGVWCSMWDVFDVCVVCGLQCVMCLMCVCDKVREI